MSTPPSASPFGAGPELRREAIERRILASTQAVIDEGVRWHQLGIRQITERADISRTAFYEFFGSKNEVLEHLTRGIYEELSVGVREQLDPAALGYFDLTMLRPALAAVTAFAQLRGHTYRALLDASGEDPALAQLWNELVDAFTDVVALSIEVVRRDYDDAPTSTPVRSLARALLLMTERCLIAGPSGPPPASDAQPVIDALADIWERAVFGTSPAPAPAEPSPER